MTTEIKPQCTTCGNPITGKGKSTLCYPCWNAQSQSTRMPSMWTQRFSYKAHHPEPVTLEGKCVHWWAIPTETTGNGVYPSVCKKCGMQRDFAPWRGETYTVQHKKEAA